MRTPIWKTTLALLSAMAAALAGPALAETPQTDGTVNVSTVYRTLDATTWDLQRWTWKGNHDNLQMESLLRGDLSFGPRGKDVNDFIEMDYIPYDQLEGSLAESWEVKQDPMRVIFHLRKGVYWQDVPGVMKRRELVANDVITSFKTRWASSRAIPTYWEFVDRWEAPDDHTVVAYFKQFHGNWPYRLAWGFYDGILPPEWQNLSEEKRADWHNAAGTGPYRIESIQTGRQQVYVKNKDYWDTTTIDGKEYTLPLNNKVIYHIIKDEAAAVAALSTGRLDIMEAVRWQLVDQLKKSAPELITRKFVGTQGTYVALRTDQKPFNDVRVRRAMNLAVDQRAILDSLLNGEGALLNYPFAQRWNNYYTPLEKLSPKARELFDYKPEEAKKLLAEAGYPNGFSFDLQACSCSPYQMDLVAMLQAYYQQIGVKMNIKTLEYGAYRANMRGKNQAGGYLMNNSSGNPIAVLRKSFMSGQTWNASWYSNEDFDRRIEAAITEPDQEKRDTELRQLNDFIIEEAVPHVWLPTEMVYSAWWPWVKNYYGELRVGATKPNTIYARIWIDEDMKKKMLND
ncbi:ABC transporter substrate-binding protein [Alloalcanivorax mobilis]|uniref:ABC transporter substrate-binding protein n=1 Tax=Alloalcanivorax mobilis TaxID=2019569 RepID=UPI00130006AB|nr:ABC transporter substrate-binding protein [Alloalcanivorax mobilis]